MGNLCFFRVLTPEMLEECGISVEKYEFTYKYKNEHYELRQKGGSTIKLSDPHDIWNVESEGLILNKTMHIAYPELLKGPSGIACRGAEIGLCIIWTSSKLTQTGCISPVRDTYAPTGRTVQFEYAFLPGTVTGDLELSLVMYIKKSSDTVLEDETGLINESGVTVGELEKIVLDFNSLYMEFPVEECYSESDPLWWVEFSGSEWEDPKTIDMFSRDSFCLYLNSFYDACPSLTVTDGGSGIRNFDLLVDILAQTFLMIYQRLSEEDKKATRDNVGLTNNTICSVFHQFIEDRYEDYHWESPEALLKSLQINIRKMLLEDLQ